MLNKIVVGRQFLVPSQPDLSYNARSYHIRVNLRESKMLEYDRKKLGQYLKDTREKVASMTQAEVSLKLGYTSPQFISNIERGISVAPLKTLSKMVALYKVGPDHVVKIILESQRKLLREKLAKSK